MKSAVARASARHAPSTAQSPEAIIKTALGVTAAKINPQYRGQLVRARDPTAPLKSQVQYPRQPERARGEHASAIGRSPLKPARIRRPTRAQESTKPRDQIRCAEVR